MVELLVAMSLFGVVMMAMAGVFIASAKSVGDQRLRTAATRLASDHLESLRGLPFAELDLPAVLAPTTATAHGKTFTIATTVRLIDAATGAPALDPSAEEIKELTATVTWTVPGGTRTVSTTTAMAGDPRLAVAVRVIGSISMIPSPASTGPDGRPLQDIEVTVPMVGFSVGTLVNVSWTNKDGTAGAKTLTSTTGLNWRGTIAKEQVLGDLALGSVLFTVSAGSLPPSIYSLSLLGLVPDPPVVTGATIDRNPVIVASPTGNKTCADANQCQNTTDVVLNVTSTGLDQTKDSVIVQFQLHDSTFVELPLTPVSGESGHWRLTVRRSTTKFRAGADRSFHFTATRTADSAAAPPIPEATASFTVLRTVSVAP